MANDPNTIQYVIQEDGFWYVASKEKNPYVPELTVSAKGIANGLSTEYNDGWDFGPDSYDPTSTASIPYTTTVGWNEAITYVFNNGGGKIVVKAGIYAISSTAINKYGNLINIPTNSATNGVSNSNVISITIEGEASGMPWFETSVTNNKSGVIIYVTSTAPTPPTGYYASIFGVDPNPNNPRYINNISLYMDSIVIMQNTPASWTAYNFQFCQSLRVGGIKAQVTEATLTELPTNTNAIGVIPPMGFTNGIIGVEVIVIGYYAGILQGASMNLLRVGVFYCNVAIGGQISNPPSETNYLGHPSIITLADLQLCANYLGNSEFPLFGLSVTALEIMELNISDGTSTSPFATSSYIYAPATLPSGESYEQVIVGYWMNYVGSNIDIQGYIFNQPLSNIKILRFSYYTNNGGTAPTISANPPVSAKVYQNTNPYDIEIDLPVYASTAGTAGYVTIAKGSTDSPTSIGNQYVSGDTSDTSEQIIRLRVPTGWYYEFTASGVTFGTASVFAD